MESDEDEEKSTETCKTEDSTQEVETKDDNDTEQNKNSQENDREDDAKQCWIFTQFLMNMTQDILIYVPQ